MIIMDETDGIFALFILFLIGLIVFFVWWYSPNIRLAHRSWVNTRKELVDELKRGKE